MVIFYWLALVLTHSVADMVGGMLPSVLPNLMAKFDTRLLGGTALLFVFALGANGGQLFVGMATDARRSLRGLIVVAPVLACVPLFMGWVDSYVTLCGLLLAGGTALAFFHPIGLSEVQTLRSPPRGLRVSVFLSAGFCGWACGSYLSAWIVETHGLKWLWVPIVPAAILGAVLFILQRASTKRAGGARAYEPPRQRRSTGYSFRAVWVTAILVATTSSALVKLMPTYLYQKHGTVLPGGKANMFFGLAGAAGGIFFGWLSDRVRRGYVCAAALAMGTCCVAAFFLIEDASIVWFGLGGFGLGSAFPVLVTMSHEARGRESSLRNGLMIGGVWGVAGLLVLGVAKAADTWGLDRVLPWVVVLPPLAAAAVLALEKTASRKVQCQERSAAAAAGDVGDLGDV